MIVSLLLVTGCFENEIVRITVDYPYGETRLMLVGTGESFLFSGNKTDFQVVEKDVFSARKVYAGLKDHLLPFLYGTQPEPGRPYGTVHVDYGDGRRESFFLADGTFALQMFETARSRLIANPAFQMP